MAEIKQQSNQEREDKQVVSRTKKRSFWKKLVLGVLFICGIIYGLRFIPGYRSSDQLYLENVVFQPLFDFLSAEEKDFSNLVHYEVDYNLFDPNMSLIEQDLFEQRLEDKGFNGHFYIKKDNREARYPSHITDVNQIMLPDEAQTYFNAERMVPILKKELFSQLLVRDDLKKHSVSGLREISYYVMGQSNLRKELEKFLSIESDHIILIRFGFNVGAGYGVYTFTIDARSEKNRILYILSLALKENIDMAD